MWACWCCCCSGAKSDAFTLSILGENGLSINLYTILFIAFFGIGYGAYYATADMPIPMVADCSDYETYRSGKYIPGIMGTLFSLVDKLVSSLSATHRKARGLVFVQNTKCENCKTRLTAWASCSRTLPPRGRSSRGQPARFAGR